MSWQPTISQKTEMLTGTSVLVVLFLKMHGAARTCSNRTSLYMLKVRLSSFKKVGFICFIENPLKMMKNSFYFILKASFVLEIFKFLSCLLPSCKKTFR